MFGSNFLNFKPWEAWLFVWLLACGVINSLLYLLLLARWIYDHVVIV